MSVYSTQGPQASSGTVPSAQERLDSWKEIAAYLRRDERTVRRWEKSQGMPVHRHPHSKQASVYAYRAELDAWWNNGHERLAALAAVEPREKSSPSDRAWRWALGSVGVMAIIAAVVWLASRPQQAAEAPGVVAASPGVAIAIAPLQNLSGSDDLNYLGLGVADAIADRLSYGAARAVVLDGNRGEVVGPSSDLAAVAQRARASLLVRGSYLKTLERLRVQLQLVRLPEATVAWQRTIDTNLAGLVTLGDVVAEQALPGVTLPHAETGSGAEPDGAAHEVFFRGVEKATRGNPAGAALHFEEALRQNAEHAAAQAQLALSYLGSVYAVAADQEKEEKAVTLLRSAMARNAASPMLLAACGFMLTELGRLEEGVAALRQAVEINPRHAEARLWLSQAYRYGGALEESLREAQEALRLDPELREATTINTYLYLGKYQEFLAGMPSRVLTARKTFYVGLAHLYQGDVARAEGEFAKARRIEPGQLHALYGEVFRLATSGRHEAGRRLLRELESRPQADGEMLYKMAQGAALLGDKPSALRLLRQTVEAEFYCHSCIVRDPLLASLHGDAEFESVLVAAQKKQEAFRRRFLP